jgi:hypothetical protein
VILGDVVIVPLDETDDVIVALDDTVILIDDDEVLDDVLEEVIVRELVGDVDPDLLGLEEEDGELDKVQLDEGDVVKVIDVVAVILNVSLGVVVDVLEEVIVLEPVGDTELVALTVELNDNVAVPLTVLLDVTEFDDDPVDVVVLVFVGVADDDLLDELDFELELVDD